MRWVVFVLVVACSSKEPEGKRLPPKQADAGLPTYSEDPPWDAADVDARAIETGTVTVEIPSVRGAQPREGALVIARVGDGWRKVDPRVLIVTADGVQVPPGESLELADVARAATPAGVLVIEDGKRLVDADLGFALANECWTYAALDANAVGGLWPDPCPANTPEGKDVAQVALALGRMHTLGVTSTREITRSGEIDDILGKLREIKARPAFAKRTDVVYTTLGVTVEKLLPMLAQIHETGFTGTRWVPPVWIPMRFDDDVGFEPPPPPQPIGQPPRPIGVSPLQQVTVKIGDARTAKSSPLAADELSRVVRSRAGVFRACYQRELNRTPGMAGILTVSVDVGAAGEVTAANLKGTLRDAALQQCLRANFMRLRFPPRGAQTRFDVTLTFSSS